MSNPNNCATCDYKKLNANREKGHCYMFKDAPTHLCMQHTMRNSGSFVSFKAAKEYLTVTGDEGEQQ